MSKFGLTDERYNQMMKSYDGDEKVIESIVHDWGVEDCNKGYAIFDYNGTDLLELCKIDDVDAFESDYDASIKAECDGIKIIPKDELPENMPFDMEHCRWIDTEENRNNIFTFQKNDGTTNKRRSRSIWNTDFFR